MLLCACVCERVKSKGKKECRQTSCDYVTKTPTNVIFSTIIIILCFIVLYYCVFFHTMLFLQTEQQQLFNCICFYYPKLSINLGRKSLASQAFYEKKLCWCIGKESLYTDRDPFSHVYNQKGH